MKQRGRRRRRASWADAPEDVLGLITGRLPTLADRFRFGAVCRPWHAAERRLPRPKQLPWLALSLPSSRRADRAAFYSVSDKAVYELPFHAGGGASARLCGSADDWLVVAHGERGNFLCNPFAGATLPLPHQATITRSSFRFQEGRRSEWVQYYPRRHEPEPHIRKAVLSRAPSADDPGRCVVAAIVDSGELFFCRPGQRCWRRPRARDGSRFHDKVNGVVFRNGMLYALATLNSHGDTMRVFAVDEGVNELVESRVVDGGFLKKLPDYRSDVPQQYEPGHERRYLVESRGRLLMVECYYFRYRNDVRRTHLFKVFHRTPMTMEPYRSPIEPWMPLEGLDGEVLFLGGSGSRSFAASEFGGDDADCIYFTDDHYPGEENSHSFLRGDDSLDDVVQMELRKRPCHDIGRFCMRDKSVTFLNLEELPSNERRSPPTWLYLSDRRR